MASRSGRSLHQRLNQLEGLLHRRKDHPLLAILRRRPEHTLAAAGMLPDSWQQELLRSQAQRLLLLCARQVGKSTVAAALALHTALQQPHAPVLLLSPSLRQSGELYRKVVELFRRLGRPMGVVAESAQRLELANGARIVSLPGDEQTIRGFSGVAMLIIDEAARVDDALYCAVRPMLAISRGRLVALSTPFGLRGWFHSEWDTSGDWQKVRITAEECPRISATFLAEERRALGERWYRQEYLCSFEESIDAVFSYADIQAALADIAPLDLRGASPT
jgi:hypothetical protein